MPPDRRARPARWTPGRAEQTIDRAATVAPERGGDAACDLVIPISPVAREEAREVGRGMAASSWLLGRRSRSGGWEHFSRGGGASRGAGTARRAAALRDRRRPGPGRDAHGAARIARRRAASCSPPTARAPTTTSARCSCRCPASRRRARARWARSRRCRCAGATPIRCASSSTACRSTSPRAAPSTSRRCRWATSSASRSIAASRRSAFGESALGGIVSITTRTPGRRPWRARAGMGSFGTYFGDASAAIGRGGCASTWASTRCRRWGTFRTRTTTARRSTPPTTRPRRARTTTSPGRRRPARGRRPAGPSHARRRR